MDPFVPASWHHVNATLFVALMCGRVLKSGWDPDRLLFANHDLGIVPWAYLSFYA